MTGKHKQLYKDKVKEFPIWKLTEVCHVIEKRIFDLKKQGETNSKTLSKLRYKRGCYREVLLEKLKEWKKDKSKEELTYADTQENYSQEILEVCGDV